MEDLVDRNEIKSYHTDPLSTAANMNQNAEDPRLYHQQCLELFETFAGSNQSNGNLLQHLHIAIKGDPKDEMTLKPLQVALTRNFSG